jgi:23S rRNA (adenine2030-N6)-methyltransferase
MNYRHAFHAGNFADVLKHAVLVRILLHLRAKPAAFRVIDTHAGAGRYDLGGPEATRSLEWREGIERLVAAPIGEPARLLLGPYLNAIAAFNNPGSLTCYPGSPALVRAFLRAQDRLLACELEPNAAAALARYLAGDRRSKALAIDGWTALHAYVPPKERRGLVLVDPSFEDAGDFARLGEALEAAQRKWAGGTYLLWYPVKERAGPDALAQRHCKDFACRAQSRRNARRQSTRRLRADRRQSAVDARRRACNSAAGAGGYPLSGERRRPSRRLGRKRKVVSPLFHSPRLAYFHGCWL